jgi:hypothetical protein
MGGPAGTVSKAFAVCLRTFVQRRFAAILASGW